MPLSTEPVVQTDFTGADENPLSQGGNFLGPVTTGRELVKRVNNQAAADETTGTGIKETYWNTSIAANSYCALTLAVVPPTADIVRISLRIANPGAAPTQVTGIYKPGTGWSIQHNVAGAGVTIAGPVAGVTLANGEKMALEAIGPELSLYAYQSGVWSLILKGWTPSVVSAGFPGFTIDDVGGTFVTRVDDFAFGTAGGGGSVGWVKSS